MYGIASPDRFPRAMISCNIKRLEWHIMLQKHLSAACTQHSWRRRYHVLEFHVAESRVPTLSHGARWLPSHKTALFVGEQSWWKSMPKARKSSSVTDSNVCDTDVMLLRFLELLSDDQVVRKLKSALYPQALSDKLDTLTQTIAGLTSQLEGKECRITVLEEQVELLQSECDNLEQYSRRCNLRIHGIPETGDGEDTTLKVLELVNAKMAVTPPQSLKRTL